MSRKTPNDRLLTFGGHLEVLRQMLFHVLFVAGIAALAVFCFKEITWRILLAPSEYDFCTYRWIEALMRLFGNEKICLEAFHVDLIATDLSSQFMTHLTTSIYIGLLVSSPYILYEMFRFISPALYDKERLYSVKIIISVYFLFIMGLLISYFLIFPISFRFLGTYSVSERIHSTITLDSYISTFISLTLLMGIVFQLPVIAFVLGKIGLINAPMLIHYRKHAFLLIMTTAAIITPGQDILTLTLVTLPLYLLYEASIRVVKAIK